MVYDASDLVTDPKATWMQLSGKPGFDFAASCKRHLDRYCRFPTTQLAIGIQPMLRSRTAFALKVTE